MARTKMVTRTVEFTVAELMVVNTTTAEVSILTKKYTGDFKDSEDLKKYLTKNMVDSDLTVVKVTIVGTEEKLYGMTESDFLNYAKEIDSRTAKI